jgi:hypothetical protein
MRLLETIAAAAILVLPVGAAAYEQPPYSVAKQHDGFEIRSYAPYLVAETTAEGDFESARNAAFRRLFDYISGGNKPGERIAMTVPVTSDASDRGEKIEMTVPVATAELPGRRAHVMQFVVPSKYTPETVPQPLDGRVTVRRLDAQLMAVRTYSGRSNEANFRENETWLLQRLAQAGYTPKAKPVLAVYNGPFTPWFLRRNEVMVIVEATAHIQR